MSETADIVVIDGEGAGSTPWEWTSIAEGDGNTFALSAAAAAHETNGYRAALGGVNTTAAVGNKDFVSADTSIYVRFYVKLSSNFDCGNATDRVDLVYLISDVSTLALIGVNTANADGIPTRWHMWFRETDPTWYDSTTNFSLNAWHYIDILWTKDATIGGADVWVDGTNVHTSTHGNTTDVTFDTLRIGACYIGAGAAVGTADYDDILINTTGPIGAYSGDPISWTTHTHRTVVFG